MTLNHTRYRHGISKLDNVHKKNTQENSNTQLVLVSVNKDMSMKIP